MRAVSWAGEVMLRPAVFVRWSRSKRTTPPSSPASIAFRKALLAGSVVPRKPTMRRRPIFWRSVTEDVGAAVAVGATVGVGLGGGPNEVAGVVVGRADASGGALASGVQAATIAAVAAPSPTRNRRLDREPVRPSVPGSP